MLDAHGLVAEGTGENICAIKIGVVKTPSVTNILAGITRRTAIEILDHLGVSVDETLFGRDALYVADEVFMTGTAAEITPVRQADAAPWAAAARASPCSKSSSRRRRVIGSSSCAPC